MMQKHATMAKVAAHTPGARLHPVRRPAPQQQRQLHRPALPNRPMQHRLLPSCHKLTRQSPSSGTPVPSSNAKGCTKHPGTVA
eukprot:CAMPEP_0172783486 /NCGR_PEP_ID=MMETSP1074-20121228/204457_1 /TAXON_ID=2916 /ORGANISM="Ceratium fusus, Strain PA161109" /LENGTH=82 /DNA_ID=CAMNT_0013620475 /DNA_START=1429 /DNA_END=1673 /DNA_ORIENTATION=+